MLIPSQHLGNPTKEASLSRGMNANSQPVEIQKTGTRKSIKRDEC